MTADIEMLPLPGAMVQLGEGRAALQAWGYEQMRAYARAVAEHNVAARDAELVELRSTIEALRADAMQSATDYQILRDFADRETVRADRLAEALRKLEGREQSESFLEANDE